MFFLLGIPFGIFLLVLYLRHVNNGMKQTPSEALELSPHRFTDEEIRETYQKVSAKPLDWTPYLPPKLQRRYVVVGGSGLVGGFLVLHLLARGESAESIRIVDFRKPFRKDLTRGKANDVEFVQTDITNVASIKSAFAKQWPKSVSSLPLTVFHTAAAIRPGERAEIFLNRCAIVNVNGTENVITAARSAGADILIATSSASISIRPTNFWIAPWQKMPKRFVQVYLDPEKDQNLRPLSEYFANYAWTKARAEDLVMKANGRHLKTGCIRPACPVYGNEYDLSFGAHMAAGHVETWIPHMMQNFVHAENISLSHLLYEAALLQNSQGTGGGTFVITDPNDPISFGDIYKILNQVNRCKINYIPPWLILTMAYAIETYCLILARFPILGRMGLKEPAGNLQLLQPSTVISSNVFQYASDQPARKAVRDGGLGYKPPFTTLEGLVNQAARFNKQSGRKPVWE